MIYNYSKLRGKIKEMIGSETEFAGLLNMSPASLSYKLNNKSYFSQDEIDKAVKLLNIIPNEISLYFFNKKVEKNSTILKERKFI